MSRTSLRTPRSRAGAAFALALALLAAPPAFAEATDDDAIALPAPDADAVEGHPAGSAHPAASPLAAAPATVSPALTLAPADPVQLRVTPSGQILARFRHAEGRDFLPGNVSNTVTQRSRAALRFDYGRVGAFVQLQDVRVWGEETDTLGDFSADGLDLHQGFLQINLTDGLDLRVGRQEINWLNQRLIGSVGFAEQARSLDGVRLSHVCPEGRSVADLFYARTRDGIAADDARAEHVVAGMWQYKLDAAFVPAIVAIVDLNGPFDRTRVTTGLHATGVFDFGLSYILEGYFQGGSAANEVSISAFFTALNVRYTLTDTPTRPFIEVRAEMASGDDDPDDTSVTSFDTLFATNHRYYGEMDFFLNLPANTDQRGLIDLGGAIGLSPHDNVDLSLAAHIFSAQQARGGPSGFGTELDLRAEWRAMKHLRFDVVYAIFLPGDGFTGGNPEAGAEHFVYATADASF